MTGNRGAASDPRERVWCDDGQEETLRVAGPDFGPIRPHGQRLLCVRSRPRLTVDGAAALPSPLKHVTCPVYRIALTKLDILDTLPEIKVGVAYKVDGEPLPSFPGRSFPSRVTDPVQILGHNSASYIFMAQTD